MRGVETEKQCRIQWDVFPRHKFIIKNPRFLHILSPVFVPNLNVGLVAAVLALFSLNAYADQTAFHLGTYSTLKSFYQNNSATTQLNTLESLYSNMTTYGVALNGCDSGAAQLAITGSGTNCTMANWYNTNYGYSGISVFCFTTQDACFKFSGRLADVSGTRGNTNSKTNLTKGYKLSDTGITYLNSTTASQYQRSVTITNDEFFQCLRDCPTKTGWTTVYDSDGTTIKYEQNISKWCSSNTASTCSNVTQSTAHSFRCPAEYYNAQGTTAQVTSSTSSLTCTPCPSLPKRDGTTCAISQPGAGLGRSITSCMLAGGCESYDDTGDYMFLGSCSYTN